MGQSCFRCSLVYGTTGAQSQKPCGSWTLDRGGRSERTETSASNYLIQDASCPELYSGSAPTDQVHSTAISQQCRIFSTPHHRTLKGDRSGIQVSQHYSPCQYRQHVSPDRALRDREAQGFRPAHALVRAADVPGSHGHPGLMPMYLLLAAYSHLTAMN